MGLFNRKKGGGDGDENKQKGAWRKPANTAFKQQRLKAWQPILTPKTVLPTLFIIGIIFGPIGGLLIWGSGLVSEMTFDYSGCDSLTPSTSTSELAFTGIPSDKYSYRLSDKHSKAAISKPPQYAFLDHTNSSSDPSQEKECVVEFVVPVDLDPGIFFYYKLTNFYQNHRRYVKSLDSDQLRGKKVSAGDLDNGDCKPLASSGGKAIYPCGLIANSVFNDTFSTTLSLRNPPSGASDTYNLSTTGIAWPGEKKKYTNNPVGSDGYASYDDIVPPPNWEKRYPGGYNETNYPKLADDEHFQNWMRTAGLPTFTKLYGRNDNDKLLAGTYRVTIGMNFPVTPYKGTKSFVISTVSWIGGKNPFLGWAYVAAAALFVLLAIIGTARHLIKPRRLGDMSLLSWNR